MKLVVDANILIASLIRKGGTAKLLVNPSFELYSPEFIIEEILKYAEEISGKTKRVNLADMLYDLHSIITFVKKEELDSYLEKAKLISPDIKDAMYLALALKLNCPIWSNDKLLKNQTQIKVYSTSELMTKFSSK